MNEKIKLGIPKAELKLFVWNDFSSDYTPGLAVAIATTETEAREAVIKALGINWNPSDWGELSVHDFNSPIAFAVTGGG